MMNTSLRCSRLAYIAAITVLLTIHLCFLVSVWQGYIDWCNPYWTDCVSISHSGRHGLAYFIFKGGMLPAALMLALFWQLNAHWLHEMWLSEIWLREPGLKSLNAPFSAQRVLPPLGWIASSALAVYALSLGHAGETFQNLRRFGVVTFMGLSYIGFALLAGALRKSSLHLQGRRLQASSMAILSLALFSLLLDAVLAEGYDRLENAFEWWFVLLLLGQMLWVARLWQQSGFELTVKKVSATTAYTDKM